MNTTTMSVTPHTAAKDWDEARTAFASSIMVDTALTSLAQNLDGLEWPLTGADETPAGYIDLTYNEVLQILSARGHPEGVELLTRILRETIAFDAPFGEMVKQTEASARRDNPLMRTLTRLQIPEDFPISLTALDESARELCQLEHLETIGQFALFAQGLSQSVIVGGDFRRLLNALSHVDERGLSDLLPFRVGTTGLHLMEALVQATRVAHPEQHTAQAMAWFSQEFEEWRQRSEKEPQYVSQLVMGSNPLDSATRVLALLEPYFPSVKSSKGLWATICGWFKRQ